MPRRAGGADPDGTVEVELVEADDVLDAMRAAHGDDDPLTGLEDPDTPDRAAAAPERRRRHWRWVAGAVAAVLVVAVVNVVEVRRDAARLEALSAIPGVLAPVAEPLTQVWRADDAYPMTAVGDTVLLDGVDGMRAVDAATGEEVWRTGAPDETGFHVYCVPLSYLEEPFSAGPGFLAQATGDELVCQRSSASTTPEAVPDPVTVVSAATGETLRAFSHPGSVVSIEPHDGDVVVLQAGADGHLTMTRWDPRSGEEGWQLRSAAPVFSPGEFYLERWERYGSVLLVAGRVASQEVSVVAVDLDRGVEVDPGEAGREADPYRMESPLPDGRVAVVEHGQEGPSAAVEDADGTVLFPLDGAVLVPAVDDGSAPDVLAVASFGGTYLYGVDATSGERLWAYDLEADATASYDTVDTSPNGLVRLDGRLVLAWEGRVLAVDLRTGGVLWDEPADPTVWFPGLSDGARLVAPLAEGTEHYLVARSLETGAEVWRTRLPVGAHGLAVTPSGHVLVMTPVGLVALG